MSYRDSNAVKRGFVPMTVHVAGCYELDSDTMDLQYDDVLP